VIESQRIELDYQIAVKHIADFYRESIWCTVIILFSRMFKLRTIRSDKK